MKDIIKNKGIANSDCVLLPKTELLLLIEKTTIISIVGSFVEFILKKIKK